MRTSVSDTRSPYASNAIACAPDNAVGTYQFDPASWTATTLPFTLYKTPGPANVSVSSP